MHEETVDLLFNSSICVSITKMCNWIINIELVMCICMIALNMKSKHLCVLTKTTSQACSLFIWCNYKTLVHVYKKQWEIGLVECRRIENDNTTDEITSGTMQAHTGMETGGKRNVDGITLGHTLGKAGMKSTNVKVIPG